MPPRTTFSSSPVIRGRYRAALESQEASSWVDSTYLEPGKTYYLRVQAIRATELGWFVAAQSSVSTYVVPL